jgi:hypothetical protein
MKRKRVLASVLFIALVVLAIQSFTVSLPIRAQVVDARDGMPLKGATVVAVWELEAITPAGAVPGPYLKINEATSDEHGRVRVGAAVTPHLPLFPLSPLMRSRAGMPKLIVIRNGYHAQRFGKQSGLAALQRSTLDRRTLQLEPRESPLFASNPNEYEHRLSIARGEINRAANTCESRWYCQFDSLPSTWKQLAKMAGN